MKHSSSDDEEAFDFSESASCQPSQDIPGEALLWDDLVPAEVSFSGRWAPGHEENVLSGGSDEDMAVGDDEPYSILQTYSSEGSRFTVSEKSLMPRSSCDSGFHDEDEDQLTSTDVSPLLAPEWCIRMVLSAYLNNSQTLITIPRESIRAQSAVKILQPPITIWIHNLIYVSLTTT